MDYKKWTTAGLTFDTFFLVACFFQQVSETTPSPSPVFLKISDFTQTPTPSSLSSSPTSSSVISTSNSPKYNYSGEKSDDDKEIWLLGLFPLRGSWPGGLGQLPAVEIGLEDVNKHPHILSGYKLRMTMDDTKCDAGHGTNLLYRQLYTKPIKTLVLGAGCSAVSQATAQVSHLWNLVQLSYSSASPALSDKKIYKKFLRVFPPETSFNSAKFDLLSSFNWKKVGTLHQSVELFSMTTLDFVGRSAAMGIQIMTSESFVNDPKQQVRNLKKQGVRIVVGNFYENFARVIFCEAYKEKMYGAKYAWIITGFFSPEWWKNTSSSPSHDCSVEQLEEAIKGYFTADALPFSHSNTTGISGKSYHEFHEEYKKRTRGRDLTAQQEAPYGYDSVWTVAAIFNKSLEIMKQRGWNRRLEDFQYDDWEMSDLFWNVSSSLKFQGVSGLVMFDSKGDRQGLSQIEQLQNGREVQVGIYDPSLSSENKIIWNHDKHIAWQSGVPPPDSIIEKVTTKVISLGLFVLVTVLASLGIVLSCCFFFFNVKYKRNKYIKMSSPNMNNAILLGAVVSYTSMVFAGIDSNLASRGIQLLACQLFHWTLALGFSLAFGAMFSKTWRVHKIFTNKKIQKMVIKDYQLLGIVCILVMVDVVVLVVWKVFDPLYVTTLIRPMEYVNDPENDNQVLIPQNQFCESHYMWYFAGVLCGVKGLLLLFGAFLAYETRKVTVPALNDSKFIGISVYNVVVLCLIGVPTAVMIRDQVDAAYLLTSLFTFFATTLTICLVFIPKTLKRNREPQTRSMWLKAKEAARAAALANSAVEGKSEQQVQSPLNDLQSLEGHGHDNDVEQIRQENERLKLALQKCCRLLSERYYEILPFGDFPSPQTQSEEMTPSMLSTSTSMPVLKNDKH